jgi:hypothetical protein
MPALDLSEAEVIRRIFRMAAEERQSCSRIADYLDALSVPCAGSRPGRPSPAGKWRAGGVRNLLVSTVYKGQHVYGKRSRNAQRGPIVRRFPQPLNGAQSLLAPPSNAETLRRFQRESQALGRLHRPPIDARRFHGVHKQMHLSRAIRLHIFASPIHFIRCVGRCWIW